MPTHTVDLLERLEIEWDSDSDADVKENQNKSRHTTIFVGKHLTTSGRRIAGHKRAMKARMNAQNLNTPKSINSQVLLSITASPAQRHSSFEAGPLKMCHRELRLECYMQSKVAKGGPPAPVDTLAMPWAVIPPMFKEFKDEKPLDLKVDLVGVQFQDVIMKEDFF